MRCLCVFLGLFAACGPAWADDLALFAAGPPSGAGRSWSGFYVGAVAGYAGSTTPIRLTPTGTWLSDTEAPFLAGVGSPTLRGAGVLGGVELGYNLQRGSYVYGLSADFAGTSAGGSRFIGPFAPFADTGDTYRFVSSTSTRWISTLRARVGAVVWPSTFVYATGGLAVADFSFRNGYIFGLGPGLGGSLIPQTALGSARSVNAGWVIGGGIERALTDRVSLKGEALYADLGKGGGFSTAEFIGSVPTNNGYTTTNQARLTELLVRIGLNYRLSGE